MSEFLEAVAHVHQKNPLNPATPTATTAATVHAHLAHFLSRGRFMPGVYPAFGTVPHSGHFASAASPRRS